MDLAKLLRQDLAFLVLALLLAYGIYNTAGVALGTDVPVVAITSGSMEPTLHRGDMIVVQGVPFDELEVGDIIVFRTDGMVVPVVHRIVEKNASTVATQGDALRRQHDFEKRIEPDQIHGKYRFAVPYIGYVKLVPTCIYLQVQGVRGDVLDRVCPVGQL